MDGAALEAGAAALDAGAALEDDKFFKSNMKRRKKDFAKAAKSK